MLQNMQKKVEAEGEREKDLHEKFFCYCKTSDASLGKSIEEGSAKIPQLESAIKGAAASKEQLGADLVEHKSDRTEANDAIAKANKIRAKEEAAFTKESTESRTNIKAIGRAVGAIEKGLGGFLQTQEASSLKYLINNTNYKFLSEDDREQVVSFLSASSSTSTSSSGEIVGILKTMKEQMEKDLAESTAEENEAVTNSKALLASKQKEVGAATTAIEKKTARLGEVSVELVNAQNDLEDTQDALGEDQKLLRELKANCATKQKEFDEKNRIRGEELLALSDTVKILNDDDALDLFKKTIPSPSFLQMSTTSKQLKKQADNIITQMRNTYKMNDVKLDLISLALKGKKVGFEKVLTMMDEMSALLKQEQVDDETKKGYCNDELEKSDDQKVSTERDIKDLNGNIAENEDSISSLRNEINALREGVASLDKQVAEAGEQRKEEHQEFTQLVTNNNQAKELIEFAKNRMNKFYNPNLYKAPKQAEMSEEDKLFVEGGGELAPTAAPGGIAGTGIGLVQKSSGVIRMMDMMVVDINKEIHEAEMEEKGSSTAYNDMIQDATAKRAADNKSITEKSAALADAEESFENNKAEKKAKSTELVNINGTITNLHKDCDFLLQNFDMRKEARSNEIEGIQKAKAVLSGADFSFVQVQSHTKRLRGQ